MLLSACLFSANELHELENPPLGRLSKFIEILEDFSSNQSRANTATATMMLLGLSYKPDLAGYLVAPIFVSACQNFVDSFLYGDCKPSRYLATLTQSYAVQHIIKSFWSGVSLSSTEYIILSYLSVLTSWVNILSEVGVTWELLFRAFGEFMDQMEGNY